MSVVEYSMIASVFAVMILAGINLLGQNTGAALSAASDVITAAGASGEGEGGGDGDDAGGMGMGMGMGM